MGLHHHSLHNTDDWTRGVSRLRSVSFFMRGNLKRVRPNVLERIVWEETNKIVGSTTSSVTHLMSFTSQGTE